MSESDVEGPGNRHDGDEETLENDLEQFERGIKRQKIGENSNADPAWMWFRVGEVTGQLLRKIAKLEQRVGELESQETLCGDVLKRLDEFEALADKLRGRVQDHEDGLNDRLTDVNELLSDIMERHTRLFKALA